MKIFFTIRRYLNLNVSGSDIDGVNEITSNSLVILTKWNYANNEKVEYVLNKKQTEKLKNLIAGSNYRKVLFSSVHSYESEKYEIVARNSNEEVWLIINSLGGEYISIPHQFNNKHLKIKNPNWKEIIEEILLMSN